LLSFVKAFHAIINSKANCKAVSEEVIILKSDWATKCKTVTIGQQIVTQSLIGQQIIKQSMIGQQIVKEFPIGQQIVKQFLIGQQTEKLSLIG
jgi:hypothetical protein